MADPNGHSWRDGMSSDNIKGLILALSSSIFIGSSFIVKKKGLKKAGASGVRAGFGGYSYLYEPLWWVGMITMVVGEIANFAAYAFAPAILVTPLGALSIIIRHDGDAALAHIILRERLHIFGILGCILCVVGSTTIVLHAPAEREIESVIEVWNLATEPALVITAVFILIFHYIPQYGQTHIMVYIGVCSLVGSLSVCILHTGTDYRDLDLLNMLVVNNAPFLCVWRNIYVRYVLEGNFKFSSLVNLLYNGVVLLWTFSRDCFPTCCVIVSWVLFDFTIWEYSYCGTQKELSVLWLYCWITTERLITLLNENSNILKVVYEPATQELLKVIYFVIFLIYLLFPVMQALDTFNTAVVSPIYYVMFTSLTILASVIMFKDWDRQNPTQIVTEMCGFVTILAGTFLLHKTKDLGDGSSLTPSMSLRLSKHAGNDDLESEGIPLRRQESLRTP
ncbi:hypothetical protein CUMW_175110 [Citrus unshiu]|uniref:Probable magnesium transporter n=1 Tax=Citrus unshiu TaxID=55188 RepID=A0A2H5PXQ1_CITUN|nr:hypothetical protein CUMW_175110 [Citrus unshiu]